MITEVDLATPEFERLSYLFAEESGQELDFDHFKKSWIQYTDLGMAYTWGVYDGKELQGMVGFIIMADTFSGKLTSNESFLYVTEANRGSRLGLSLINKFESLSKELGANESVIAHFNHLNGDRLKSLYEKLGYNHTEGIYRKCLK